MMKNTTLEELLAKAATADGQRQASLADLTTGREALVEVLGQIKREMLPTFGIEADAMSVVAGGASILLIDPVAASTLRAAVYQLVLGAYRLKTAGRESEANGYFAALAFLVYGAATCEEVLRGTEDAQRAADKVVTGRAI